MHHVISILNTCVLSIACKAMEKRWDELFDLLSLGTYPAGYGKSRKLNLKRYASKFILKGEYLKYNLMWIVSRSDGSLMMKVILNVHCRRRALRWRQKSH